MPFTRERQEIEHGPNPPSRPSKTNECTLVVQTRNRFADSMLNRRLVVSAHRGLRLCTHANGWKRSAGHSGGVYN